MSGRSLGFVTLLREQETKPLQCHTGVPGSQTGAVCLGLSVMCEQPPPARGPCPCPFWSPRHGYQEHATFWDLQGCPVPSLAQIPRPKSSLTHAGASHCPPRNVCWKPHLSHKRAPASLPPAPSSIPPVVQPQKLGFVLDAFFHTLHPIC